MPSKTLLFFAVLIVGLFGLSLGVKTAKATAAAALVSCTAPATTYGTVTFDATDTPPDPIVITSTAAYHIWARVQVPSANANSLLMNLDGATGTNCYNVDSTGFTANTWTWVDVTSGLTQPTLTAGNHKLLITGTQSGVSLDRIEFLSDSTCIPTGTGDNCTTTPNTPPTVTIGNPATGSTVNGTVAATATATATQSGATITSVQFQIDGVNVGTADTTSPYTYSWNTTSLTNGSTHTITAIATDSNGLTATDTNSVTVNNAPVCSTGTLASPTGLAVNGTPTYTSIGLKWNAVTPTPGCTLSGYNVYRNGSTTPINGGTLISGTSTTDSGLTSSTNYSYTVQAVDTKNTSAKSGSVSIPTKADDQAPNTPAISSHSVTASSVTLGWAAVTDNPSPGGTGVAGYNIYRNDPSASGTPLNGSTPVNATTYIDSTVNASTAYTYVITAVDSVSNESAPSTVLNVTTSAPTCSGNPSLPGKPTQTGTSTDQSFSFSWSASTASAGCTMSGYHIYQVNGSTYTLITTVLNSGTGTISVALNKSNGLTPNSSYNYAVEAFDSSSHLSDKTNTNAQITGIATIADSIAPSTPSGLTASNTSPVSLSWTGSTDDYAVTGYNIYRCTGSGCSNFSLLTNVSSTTLNYNDTSVSAGTVYNYDVKALDGTGPLSAASNTATATTPSAGGSAPGQPTSPGLGPVASQSAALQWSAPTTGGTPTGYNVYINGVLDTFNNGTVSDTFTSSGGTLHCLAPNISSPPYVITVKAFNSSGEGPATTINVTTPSGGLAGDFDCTSHVNIFDLNALATDWSRTSMQPFQGDANGDAKVNIFDLNALATNWGK